MLVLLSASVLGGETGSILEVYRANNGSYTVLCQNGDGSVRTIVGNPGLLDAVTNPCVAFSLTSVDSDTAGHTQRVVTYLAPRLDAVAKGDANYVQWIGQQKNIDLFHEWKETDKPREWFMVGALLVLVALRFLGQVRFCEKCSHWMTYVQTYWTDGTPDGHYYRCYHCNPPKD